jgi:hypothetical protein
MNQLPPKNTYTFTINRTVLWLIGFGFVLLLGVVMFEESINFTLAAEPAAVPVAETTPVAPVAKPKPATDIQSILNNPENFRVVPTDISPVEAFVDGKTTKFLMGF